MWTMREGDEGGENTASYYGGIAPTRKRKAQKQGMGNKTYDEDRGNTLKLRGEQFDCTGRRCGF